MTRPRTDEVDEVEALSARWASGRGTGSADAQGALNSSRGFNVTRTRVMLTSFIANAALLALASQLDMVSGDVVLRYTIAVMLLMAAAWLVASSGLDDAPWQWLVMIVPGMVAMYALEDTASRGAFLLLSLAPLIYELLAQSQRRFITLALGYATAYALMLVLLKANHPERINPSADKLIGFALMGLVLILSGLRALLHETLDMTRRSSDELKLALSTMAHVAEHDALTSVVNRRFLTTLIDMLTQRARRRNEPYSVVMFDVDHFKGVNDTHGHLAGDRVLQRVAMAIGADVRASDAFGRWGGEEFLLVMPDTALVPARAKAEQLRAVVEAMDWTDLVPGSRITVSCGVAQWRMGDRSEDVIARGDEGLYAAKRLGRNRVECSSASA